MEIEILKYDSKLKDYATQSLKIENYKSIAEPKSLFLAKREFYPIHEDKSDKDTNAYEFFKVQFIATCKTEFEKEILVAFYVDEFSAMAGSVISELDGQFRSPVVFLIDYKAYEEMCELTSEKKISFLEYLNLYKYERSGSNSILNYKGKLYNCDEQSELFKDLNDQGI